MKEEKDNNENMSKSANASVKHQKHTLQYTNYKISSKTRQIN